MPAFLPTGSLTGLAFLAAVAAIIRLFRGVSQPPEIDSDDDTQYGTISTKAMLKLVEDEVVRHFVVDLRQPEKSAEPTSCKRTLGGGLLNVPTTEIRRVFARRNSGEFGSRFPALQFPRKQDLIICVSDSSSECRRAVQELESCGFDCSVYVRDEANNDSPNQSSINSLGPVQFLSRHAVALLLGLTDLPSPLESVVLDVRRMDELVMFGCIQGMHHLTVNELPKALALESEAFFERYQFRKPNVDDLVVTSCRRCKRAIWAAQLFMEAGYRKVFVHKTGTYGWRFSPTVKVYDEFNLGDVVPKIKQFSKESPNANEGFIELEQFNLVPNTDSVLTP
eukprot:g4134.t1